MSKNAQDNDTISWICVTEANIRHSDVSLDPETVTPPYPADLGQPRSKIQVIDGARKRAKMCGMLEYNSQEIEYRWIYVRTDRL